MIKRGAKQSSHPKRVRKDLQRQGKEVRSWVAEILLSNYKHRSANG